MTAFTVFIIILLMVIGPSLFVVIGKQREKAIPKRPSTALPLAEDATTLDRHWQSIRNGWNEKKPGTTACLSKPPKTGNGWLN